MKNSNFYKLYKQLSTRELKQFENFLHGCYSKNTQRLQLFNYIKALKKEEPDFEKAHLQLYNKPIQADQNRKNISNLLSQLSENLDEFLILQSVKKDPLTKNLLLLRAYRNKGFDLAYQAQVKHFDKILDASKEQEMKKFWYKLLTQHSKYYSSKSNKLKKNTVQISAVMQQLDHFYIKTKLKYACEIESRNNLLAEEEQAFLIDEILHKNKHAVFKNDLFFKAFYSAYRMIKNHDKTAFRELKKILSEKSLFQNLAEVDRKVLHTYLLNFCSAKIRESQYQFVNEVFELNQYGIQEGFIFENNIIMATRFNNIVEVACKIKQVDWATDFIEKYKKFLHPEIKKDSYHLALAQVNFAQQKFDKVILHLQKVSNQDSFLYLRKNWFLISAYYETESDNHELITQNCTRFETYLNRNEQLSAEIKSGAKNFSRMVKMLIKGNKSKTHLLDELHQCNDIYFKWWLENKIENL